MRLVSLHPGVRLEDVVEHTGFELVIPNEVANTREPTEEELGWIRRLDPKGLAQKEVPG
jgi:hypothetical protein